MGRGHAARGNQTTDLSDFTDFWGVRLKAYFYLGRLTARNFSKSIQNLTKSVRTPCGILIFGTLRVEIMRKLRFKINRAAR